MKKVAVDAKVIKNTCVQEGVGYLVVSCPEIASQAEPGMFVQILVKDRPILLRRPLSIADADPMAGTLTFVYRVVGRGTAVLKTLSSTDSVNCLGPLGTGFSLTAQKPLLVGGGMGIAPLLFLAKRFSNRADVLMGGRNAKELFWPAYYRDWVQNIFLTTDDGSLGVKGFTVDYLPELLQKGRYDYLAVCGPEIMMRSVAELAKGAGIPCQVSLEKRMACGLGACLSCSLDDWQGNRRKVCKDGPVFWAQEVFYE